MSAPDPFEQHRAAFGAELRRVAPRVRRQRRRRFAALSGATVALAGAATAVVVIAPSTGTKLDVLSQARAAITTSPDSIIHFSATYTSGYPQRKVDLEQQRRNKNCSTGPGETWVSTAPGPPRYRYRLPLNRCETRPVGDRIATGSFDMAYADRTSKTYSATDDFLVEVTGLPADADDQQPIGSLPIDTRFNEGDPRDPVARIRTMLAEGMLKNAGQLRGKNGRMLQRLVGSYSVLRGDPAHPKPSKVSVDYRVDATTFAPVQIAVTSSQLVPKNPNLPIKQLRYTHRNLTDTVNFSRYETLPLNASTEHLLTVEPKPGTEVETSKWTRDLGPTPKPSAAEKARAKAVTDAQIAAGTRIRADF